MKGADQCPRCASRKWAEAPQSITSFYARVLRVCGNCKTAWEPFDEGDLLDQGERNSSFKTPCNNCAFRKGSPEHEDPVKWQALIDKLGWWDGHFYCHKGLPITPAIEDAFAYPKNRDGKPDVGKLRLCRGFLNWLNSRDAKAKLALRMLAAEAQETPS